MNEPSCVAYAHNHKLDILDASLQSGFFKNARGYIYKQQKTS